MHCVTVCGFCLQWWYTSDNQRTQLTCHTGANDVHHHSNRSTQQIHRGINYSLNYSKQLNILYDKRVSTYAQNIFVFHLDTQKWHNFGICNILCTESIFRSIMPNNKIYSGALNFVR